MNLDCLIGLSQLKKVCQEGLREEMIDDRLVLTFQILNYLS